MNQEQYSHEQFSGHRRAHRRGHRGRGHHLPADRRAAHQDQLQVRPVDLCRQACPADQRLLRPARGGSARVRRPIGRAAAQGKAAVHRAAGDQCRPAHAHRRRVTRPEHVPGEVDNEATSVTPVADRGPAPRVVLGVGGGIAAYKSCELVRRLRTAGADVTVVPTESALKFVGAATWEALSGHPVATDVFTDIPSVAHVATGQHADLVVIAPATADLLARAAAGRADDLLTATLLVTRAPVFMAPAMHTEMWTHPATVANVATLRARGVVVIDPAVGRLTGADSGAAGCRTRSTSRRWPTC